MKKVILQILVWVLRLIPLISLVLDRSYIFSKVLPFLFKGLFSLNLLRIIWITGAVCLLKYLYDRLISNKKILWTAKKFYRIFGEFIDFVSNVYDRRQNLSKEDEEQYLSYYERLRALFSDISSPLLEYLEEKHKGKSQDYARVIWDNITLFFSSPNLEEHFRRNPSKPPSDYIGVKHLIEEFIGDLKYKKYKK